MIQRSIIEQNADRNASFFFTFSQIKQFATQIKFRKSNRQYLNNKQTVLNSPDYPFQTVLKLPKFHARQFSIFSAFFHSCGTYVWSFMRVFCQMAFAINYLCCSSAIYKCFLPLHFNQLNLAVRLFANKILPLLYISWVSNFLPKSKFEFLSGATLNRYILLLELFIGK